MVAAGEKPSFLDEVDLSPAASNLDERHSLVMTVARRFLASQTTWRTYTGGSREDRHLSRAP